MVCLWYSSIPSTHPPPPTPPTPPPLLLLLLRLYFYVSELCSLIITIIIQESGPT